MKEKDLNSEKFFVSKR